MERSMKKIFIMVVGFSGIALMASGCTSFDQALGRTKTSPDEFQVVVRPPLTLPPNFSLRPGQEDDEAPAVSANAVKTDAVSISNQVLTASRTSDGSFFDAILGTDKRVDGIRQIVDEETLGIQIDRRVPTEILFGGQPNVGPNLDAAREAIRIRRALESGKPVTEGATLAKDPIEGTTLEIK